MKNFQENLFKKVEMEDSVSKPSKSDPKPKPEDIPIDLEHLPTEILIPIAKCLSYKERLKLTEVSSRWHSIVDENLGRKLFVGKACQFVPEDEERYRHQYVSVTNIGKLGVKTCYIGEIVGEEAKSAGPFGFLLRKIKESFFGSPIPKFKHPHLVENVFFDGPLPSSYFESIVKPLFNLKRLDIHLSALCCLEEQNVQFSKVGRLETLNIWGHKLTQGLFTQFYNGSLIVGNLLALLKNNQFPALTNFALEYPFDLKERSSQVTEVLLSDFLPKHGGTLKKLKLSINLFITEEPSEFESQEDREWIVKAKNASKSLNLSSMELNITTIYRVLLAKIWHAFIEGQTQLENVTVMTFRLDQAVMQRICGHNFETLHSLSMTRLNLHNHEGRFSAVDCRIFQNCEKLASILLEGMPSGTGEAGLTNLRFLPKSLEKVEIGTLTIKKEETLLLLTELPALKSVFLGDVGHQGEFGVEVGTIQRVVRERKIGSVTLYGSINGMFPSEGIGNGRPEGERMIRVRYYGLLEIKLGEGGYYDPVTRGEREDALVLADLEDGVD